MAFALKFQLISINLSRMAYLSGCLIEPSACQVVWLGLVAIRCISRYKKVISLLIHHISQSFVVAPTGSLEHNDLPESMNKLKRKMCETAKARERYDVTKHQHSPFVKPAPDHMVIAF